MTTLRTSQYESLYPSDSLWADLPSCPSSSLFSIGPAHPLSLQRGYTILGIKVLHLDLTTVHYIHYIVYCDAEIKQRMESFTQYIKLNYRRMKHHLRKSFHWLLSASSVSKLSLAPVSFISFSSHQCYWGHSKIWQSLLIISLRVTNLHQM